MGKEVEELSKFVASTHLDAIPQTVREHAKLVLLDTIGVILAGSERPEVERLRHNLVSEGAQEATVLARSLPRCDLRTAALLNGIAGRSIELCEGHRLVSGQPAIQIVPGVLAAAERFRRSGADVLAALILGYEVAGRFCTAFKARPLAHQNGQASLLAAAAAGARVRGLDADTTSRATRIAATLALVPSYTNAVAGATALNVAGGMSCVACVLAPELALAGFEAQPDAVEEALGNLVGDGFSTIGLLQDLGTRWEIQHNYFRLYACCNPVHPALDALRTVLTELHAAAGEIDRIEIATYRFASVMNNPDPPNYFASKYSLPHAAAVMVVTGGAGHRDLDDAAVHDPTIIALRHRVHVTEEKAMSALVPRLKPARVSVFLKDGRSLTRTCESHRGDFNDPFSKTEVMDKFRELAGTVLRPEGLPQLEQVLCAVDGLTDMSGFFDVLRAYGRP